MTPANSDKNLNIYVKTPTTVRSNRMYGTGKITTDSKKTYLAGCGNPDDLDHIFWPKIMINHRKFEFFLATLVGLHKFQFELFYACKDMYQFHTLSY